MTPVELLTGIEDRFALLGGGRRRQSRRTLEATLDWSYELLDTDEQAALRALGVFVGTFDLAAVAAVTALPRDVARDLVDSLIAKSLVVHEEAGGLSQFRLFETTAAYAGQRLASAGEAAFDWATGKGQWSTAAGMLQAALAVFFGHPTQGIELVERCFAHLDDEDDLVGRLVCGSYWLHLLASDQGGGAEATRRD